MRIASLVLIAVWLCGAVTAQPQISSDYDNGSLEAGLRGDDGVFMLELTEASDRLWFHFRLDDAAGASLTFSATSMRSDHFTPESVPFVSYDQVHWSPVLDRWLLPDDDGLSVDYRFRHLFAQDRAWLASAPPFSNDSLDRRLQTIARNPLVNVETLCEAPNSGRPVSIIHATDPSRPADEKATILVIAREDALESASSWTAWGMIRFLLSDDPLAGPILRRAHFMIVPVFDVDGVARGSAFHPFNDRNVFWTETWPETRVSFYEQRMMKQRLQQWGDEGRTIDLSMRLHSDGWGTDALRREHAGEIAQATQDVIFVDLLEARYAPWRANAERTEPDTRVSKTVMDFFPNAITGMMQTEWVFNGTLIDEWPLIKTPDDMIAEGELFVLAIGDWLGVRASDPAPFIHSAFFTPLSRSDRNEFVAQCVYRDLQGRAPEYVRVVIDEEYFDLSLSAPAGPDFSNGALYTGVITLADRDNTHYFIASNGSRETRSPRTGVNPGPYWLGE